MSTAILLTIGTRGDTEPFIALASQMLSASFSAVHIFVDRKYRPLIPSTPGLIPHVLPFTEDDFSPFIRNEMLKALFFAVFTRHFDLVEIQFRSIAMFVKTLVVPFFPSLVQQADQIQPSVIVASTLGSIVCDSLAELRGIPFCMINLQPATPTTAYPFAVSNMEQAIDAGKQIFRIHTDPDSHFENAQNFQTYSKLQDANMLALQDLNPLRHNYGLSDMTAQHVMHILTAGTPRLHLINSYSSQLIPASPDHSENVHVVPPLASSYLPEGWTPEKSCPDIVRYLEDGDKPICVTFGSMKPIFGYNATRVSRYLLTALRNVNAKRVLVLKSLSGIGPHSLSWIWDRDLRSWANSHVFMTDEAPQYSWLLPQCSALICHGGAGTTFAGLNAGIPVLISPVVCDQFFWSELVESMCLGAVAGPSIGETNTETFESAIKDVLSDDVRDRARSFGEEEHRRGNGSKLAAELLRSIAERTDVEE